MAKATITRRPGGDYAVGDLRAAAASDNRIAITYGLASDPAEVAMFGTFLLAAAAEVEDGLTWAEALARTYEDAARLAPTCSGATGSARAHLRGAAREGGDA